MDKRKKGEETEEQRNTRQDEREKEMTGGKKEKKKTHFVTLNVSIFACLTLSLSSKYTHSQDPVIAHRKPKTQSMATPNRSALYMQGLGTLRIKGHKHGPGPKRILLQLPHAQYQPTTAMGCAQPTHTV